MWVSLWYRKSETCQLEVLNLHFFMRRALNGDSFSSNLILVCDSKYYPKLKKTMTMKASGCAILSGHELNKTSILNKTNACRRKAGVLYFYRLKRGSSPGVVRKSRLQFAPWSLWYKSQSRNIHQNLVYHGGWYSFDTVVWQLLKK